MVLHAAPLCLHTYKCTCFVNSFGHWSLGKNIVHVDVPGYTNHKFTVLLELEDSSGVGMSYIMSWSCVMWHGILILGIIPMSNREYTVVHVFFFNLYAFILLTSTIVPGINYFVVITHPLHQLQVRRSSSSSCYLIDDRNI